MPEPIESVPQSGAPEPARRFADTFRRRPARAPRGMTPGPRVWAATGWTAAVAATTTAVLLVVPLLVSGTDEADRETAARNVVPAPERSPSPTASEKPAEPSPTPTKKTAKPAPTRTTVVRAEPKPETPPTTRAPSPTATRKTVTKETKKPAAPVWTQTVVSATNVLSTGESWRTNRIRMTMQADGNLVVYDENDKPTWAAMTFGEGHTARFQADGNLVVHNGEDRPIWASNTYGHPSAKLTLRKDGKVVITEGGTVLWST
ncbi:mannose-binding protein [Streptomyces sp. NPDC047072]|uniref:mannose-binding protein n=1 Tax=Streptomyces sp. NPDC047072 TaxID=3154809 RepID=UPI0033D0C128